EGLGVVLGLAGAPAGGGGGVVPVRRGDVVAVGPVLGLHLPVAVEGVGGGAAQHLEAFGRLVDEHVDDLGGVAAVFRQRQQVGIGAAEQESTVGVEPGDLGEVVGAVGVERVRVARTVGVLDLEQLAVVAERPAVERARERGAVVRLAAAE